MCVLNFRTFHNAPIVIPLYDPRDLHYIHQTEMLHCNHSIYECVSYTFSVFVIIKLDHI